VTAGLALLMIVTACGDPSTTAVLVVVEDVPLIADRLLVDASYARRETSMTLGDESTPLAPEGHTTFSLLVPGAAGSIEIAVRALAGDCVVGHADSGCELTHCDQLVINLSAVVGDSCGELPDAGAPLNDGRDAGAGGDAQ
jgi:hypothetical protein